MANSPSGANTPQDEVVTGLPLLQVRIPPLSSLSELSYLMVLARDLEIVPRPTWQEVDILGDYAGRLVWGLYHSLRSPLPCPRSPSHVFFQAYV